VRIPESADSRPSRARLERHQGISRERCGVF
jgi:hypothetical protein